MALRAQLHEDINNGLDKCVRRFLDVLLNHVLNAFELFGKLDEHHILRLSENVGGDLIKKSNGFFTCNDGFFEASVMFSILIVFSF